MKLEPNLIAVIASKTDKSTQYIREQISKRANRKGISAQAELTLWAKSLGLGTLTYQKTLPPEVQNQIRDMLPAVSQRSKGVPLRGREVSPADQQRQAVVLAADHLVNDQELRRRCSDLIKGRGPFDRVFREATTILEHRIRNLAGITEKMRPADLVGKVINPEPTKAILKVSDDRYEQAGYHSICNGLMLAFRDTTHHTLTDNFSREDALKFCLFVDQLLAILTRATVQKIGSLPILTNLVRKV